MTVTVFGYQNFYFRLIGHFSILVKHLTENVE